jgi:hypothetical protein
MRGKHMSEKLIRPRRTAAEELSESLLRPEDKGHKIVPVTINGTSHAVELIDGIHSLVVGLWSHKMSPYAEDDTQALEGAIKFTKDTDEIRVKYDSSDGDDLRYFAEGLTPDREIKPEDLPVWQGIIESAAKVISND